MTTETVRLPESQAAAVEREAGYIIRRLDQGKGCTYEQAVACATENATKHGSRWGVFKIVAVVEGEVKK